MLMSRFVVGIDEVGRGALAGPVVVAAALIPRGWRASVRHAGEKLGKLRDSKKLSAARRQKWFEYFTTHPKIFFAVARVYPRQIEKRNISGAANLAALRAYRKLVTANAFVMHGRTLNHNALRGHRVLLDGALFLGNGDQPNHARTIIKGDEKFKAIAIASIIAKVNRDRLMGHLAKRHPAYGFEIHKGYGTKVHRAAIAMHGPCEMHRLTFL